MTAITSSCSSAAKALENRHRQTMRPAWAILLHPKENRGQAIVHQIPLVEQHAHPKHMRPHGIYMMSSVHTADGIERTAQDAACFFEN